MVAFKDVDVALLVGAPPARPRHGAQGPAGSDGKIFAPQGQGLDKVASATSGAGCRNPVKTHCLIAMRTREPQALAVHGHDAPGP